MGLEKPERLLMAGNQQGKTHSGAAEFTYHITGLYPNWWKGHRFKTAVRAWAAGVTNQKARDVVQFKLFGRAGRWGTGFVPKDAIIDEPTMSRGLSGLIDTCYVRHKTGGQSVVRMMSYQMDAESWASDTQHLVWLDEEPSASIYDEAQARLTTTQGISFMTFTPLHGLDEVVRRFYPRASTPERGCIRMGLRDALHIPEEQRQKLARKYPAHERESRLEGIPVLGSGLVFDVPEEDVREEAFTIPSHWPRIKGIDIGGGKHPFAAVDIAWDRDADVAHVIDCYKALDPRISVHAGWLNKRDPWVPIAYPHDVNISDRGADGQSYRELFARPPNNCKMLTTHAQFSEGGYQVEPGIAMMEDRLSMQKLRVFHHLSLWFEEYRMYHRKDGLIEKTFDDLMCATRYALMMIRYARRNTSSREKLPTTVGMSYDPLGGR